MGISPSSATLDPQEQQQFAATLNPPDNPAGNHPVTWSIDAPKKGEITQQGLYTPPEDQAGTDTVRVTSNLDTSVSASATVTFDTTGGGPVTVTVAANPVNPPPLGPLETWQFDVSENPADPSIGYVWSTVPTGRGTFTVISADSVTYAAPAVIVNAETIQIRAEDQSNANVFGTTNVSLIPDPASNGPDLTVSTLTAPGLLTPGSPSTPMSLSLQNNGNQATGSFSWKVEFCSQDIGSCGSGSGCTTLVGGAVGNLDAAESISPSTAGAANIPSSVTPGEYYYAASVDTLDQVTEAEECNNFRSFPVQVFPAPGAGVDLILELLSSSSPPPSAALPTDTLILDRLGAKCNGCQLPGIPPHSEFHLLSLAKYYDTFWFLGASIYVWATQKV